MRAVVLVDAIPGFEASVRDSLTKHDEVVSIVREKEGNYDLALLVQTEDADTLERFLTNSIHTISGTKGYKHVQDPSKELLSKLKA